MERLPVDRQHVDRQNYASLPRSPLILCASLVQNPVNVGGLCRTAEVFRLQSLVVADLAIARHPLFRRAAASSHRWQPMQACPVAELPVWLQQHPYTIVALDSDADATPLPQFQFPAHSILVLGQELTGLPDSVLQVCDRSVTIPQFGLVESLNVYAAAAIAIYEYSRQHQPPQER